MKTKSSNQPKREKPQNRSMCVGQADSQVRVKNVPDYRVIGTVRQQFADFPKNMPK